MRILLLVLSLGVLSVACSSEPGSTASNDTTSATAGDAAEESDATASTDSPAVGEDASTSEPDDASGAEGPLDSSAEDTTEPIGVDEDVLEDTGNEGLVDAEEQDVEAEEDSAGPVQDTSAPVDEPDSSQNPGSESTLLCHILCDDVWSSCGDYAPYGGDQDSCVAACESMAALSQESLVAMACMGEACDAALCDPGEDVFPIEQACVEACGLFETCDLMELIQPDYPEEQALCEIQCSGGFITQGAMMGDLVHCVVDGLSQNCDPEVLNTCLGDGGPGGPGAPGGPSCQEICEISTEFKCPPWSDGPDAWEEPGACMEDCEAFSMDSDSSAYTLYGCTMSTSCEDMEKCTTPPPYDEPGCAALCQKAFQVCDEMGMPSADFCTDYCTGQLMVFGTTVSVEDAVTCLDQSPLLCDQDPYAQVLDCLLSLEDECTQICEASQACDPDPLAQPLEQCLSSCNAGYMNLFSGATTEEIATCMSAAGEDCAAQEACLAGPQPPFCFALCSSGMLCE